MGRLWVSGPWRRGMPPSHHYCHRNEAQPVVYDYYCMSECKTCRAPRTAMCFSYGTTGQAGYSSKFDVRHRRFAGRSL